jgi:hypothetical protein
MMLPAEVTDNEFRALLVVSPWCLDGQETAKVLQTSTLDES